MQRNRSRNAKPLRAVRGGPRSRKTKINKQDSALVLRAVFPGQYCTTMVLPGDFVSVPTTVTTGVIAQTVGGIVSSAQINNFATRFAEFEEYRIVKAVFILRNFASINPGLAVMWVDDSGNVAAPTAVEAQQRQGVTRFSFSDVSRPFQIVYIPHSPTEQIWNPIATVQQIAQFKLYTDNANFGSSIVATAYCEIQTMFTVQFRGIV